MPVAPRLAWYGDDFTGASDTLATLAAAGLSTLLFLDVPTPARRERAGPLDAVGIAGAARAMPPAAMRAALAPVARYFAECGARVLHYKCCSTFDSAPETGSIGVAVETLGARLQAPRIAIVGGQPSLGRYCAFGQLFAVAAPGGPAHRIDRHPTMSRHPVTPMHEADLARHLGAQGLAPIAGIDLRAYDEDGAGLALPADPRAAWLFDVTSDGQLARIGGALWRESGARPVLAVGASSVAQALIDHWGLARDARPGTVAPAAGPVFALAGSLSPVTARQVAASGAYVRIALDPEALVRDESAPRRRLVADIAAYLRAGRHVLAFTAPAAGSVERALPALAPACGRLLREVLRAVPLRRIGVAGGDTSSHAVQCLAPWALGWAGQVAPGVALCRAHADDARLDGLELMLKGGQMGGDDLFERLITGTAGRGAA